MAIERERDASVAAIVGGIVGDVQDLARKEVALAKQEIKEELNDAKEAGIRLGIGAGVLIIGAMFLMIALALGVAALLNQPSWVGFAIVGVIFAVVGGILLYLGQQRAKTIDPMPNKTIETMKENVEWIKDRTTSDKT